MKGGRRGRRIGARWRVDGGPDPRAPLQHCQAALQCLLATLPVIGCDRAPDLNRTHPQGVHRDSLGSLKLVAELKVGDTPVLRAFFERTASIIVLYVI